MHVILYLKICLYQNSSKKKKKVLKENLNYKLTRFLFDWIRGGGEQKMQNPVTKPNTSKIWSSNYSPNP